MEKGERKKEKGDRKKEPQISQINTD